MIEYTFYIFVGLKMCKLGTIPNIAHHHDFRSCSAYGFIEYEDMRDAEVGMGLMGIIWPMRCGCLWLLLLYAYAKLFTVYPKQSLPQPNHTQ